MLAHVAGGRQQEQLVRTGSSYLSQSEQALTFGLGEAERIDRLTVRWPSGHEDRFEDVDANQTLHVTEGAGASHGVADASGSFSAEP